jgi:hypothetical protein
MLQKQKFLPETLLSSKATIYHVGSIAAFRKLAASETICRWNLSHITPTTFDPHIHMPPHLQVLPHLPTVYIFSFSLLAGFRFSNSFPPRSGPRLTCFPFSDIIIDIICRWYCAWQHLRASSGMGVTHTFLVHDQHHKSSRYANEVWQRWINSIRRSSTYTLDRVTIYFKV